MSGKWIAFIVALMAAGAVLAAPPTSQPTTQPLTVAQAQQAADAADVALAGAKADCLNRLHATPEYQAALADVNAKQAARDQAVKGDDLQAKLDTGSALNIAKQAAEQLEKTAIIADPAVFRAQLNDTAAQQSLSMAQIHEAQRKQEVYAASIPPSPPPLPVRLSVGMDEKECDQIEDRRHWTKAVDEQTAQGTSVRYYSSMFSSSGWAQEDDCVFSPDGKLVDYRPIHIVGGGDGPIIGGPN